MLKLGVIAPSNPQAGATIDLANIDFSKVDFEVVYDLVWLYAKTANPEIADPITWLDDFDEFPISEILPEIMDMIQSTMGAKKK